MLRLAQASRLREGSGELLPDVWASWAERKVQFRRGQLSLVVAAPGVGKSVIALAYAIRSKVPALYFSLDTDPHTTAVRAAQMATSWTADQVEDSLLDDDMSETMLSVAKHVQFEFRPGLSIEEVALITCAYAESHGAYPELIIVDNLGNLAFSGEEAAGLRALMGDLHVLAKKVHAHVMVLHHATGEFDDGERSIPLSGIQFKLSKWPELIITLARDWSGPRLFVSPVKNRSGGNANPSGMDRIAMDVDYERMSVQ